VLKINITEQQLNIIKDILKKYLPINAVIYAFGSRVKGTNKPFSDLDILIQSPEKIDSKIILNIKEALENSSLPFMVDVLDANTIEPSFKNIILKDGLVKIDL
jgi:predicted nucleotidyltransferase